MPQLFEDSVFINVVPFAIPIKLSGNLAKAYLSKHRAKPPHLPPSSKHFAHTQKNECKVCNWIVYEVSGIQGYIKFLNFFQQKNSSENFSSQLASSFDNMCLNNRITKTKKNKKLDMNECFLSTLKPHAVPALYSNGSR